MLHLGRRIRRVGEVVLEGRAEKDPLELRLGPENNNNNDNDNDRDNDTTTTTTTTATTLNNDDKDNNHATTNKLIITWATTRRCESCSPACRRSRSSGCAVRGSGSCCRRRRRSFQSFGWHYLSNTARLIRPRLFRALRRVRDHDNLPKYSPRLQNTCVRQVMLDKWLPLSPLDIEAADVTGDASQTPDERVLIP